MPIIEVDPWRLQYFEAVSCPAHVEIPTDDPDCYRLYPRHRWIYNKLLVAESQGLECGPHGLAPTTYPVFSKPIYNLKGMGIDSYVLSSIDDYRAHLRPGHMWMTLLEGEHVSSDVAVVLGESRWWRHATGAALAGGAFDYWKLGAAPRPAIERACGEWIRRHLADYTGMVNLETIGGTIIEAHLRFSDQWPDLYGERWLDAVVRLYEHGVWQYDDRARRDAYSVVLFAAHGNDYRHPPETLVDELRVDERVSSIQITFHEDRPHRAHAAPPGGFRLAIVNCWDLDAGRAARERLARAIVGKQRSIRYLGSRPASERPEDHL